MAACNTSDPNCFILTGTGNNTVLDGIYISPYTAVVNGVTTAVICDDFVDEVAVGESWDVTTGATGSSNTGLFGAENSSQYQEVAWLSQQLLGNLSNPGIQGAISYAIWAVFENSAVKTWLNAWGDTTTYNSVFVGNNSWLAQAANHTSGNDTFTVYTPNGNETCCGPAQEFVVMQTGNLLAAEAPGPVILGIDLLGLGVLLFVCRRHILVVP